MRRPHDHAIERSQLARKARPLGQQIIDLLHQKLLPSSDIPPVPQVRTVRPAGKDGNNVRREVRKSDREAPVLHECLKWLHARGVFVYRNNSGTLWANGQPVSFGYPGSADIIGLLPGSGRFLAVECKSPMGKQSRKQIHFQEQIERSGGVYLLVRSVGELVCGIQKHLCNGSGITK